MKAYCPTVHINSVILKPAHGTGNVRKQIMPVNEAESVIRLKYSGNSSVTLKRWNKLSTIAR